MADMQAIFGKIDGDAAMMLVNNYDQLRNLTAHNRGPRRPPEASCCRNA